MQPRPADANFYSHRAPHNLSPPVFCRSPCEAPVPGLLSERSPVRGSPAWGGKSRFPSCPLSD